MMSDPRRELKASKAARLHDQREWAERERDYFSQIDKLERKLTAAQDALAEARQEIEELLHKLRVAKDTLARRSP